MRGIHRSAVDFPYKGPVMRKCFHVMCRGWIMLRHFHNFPYYSCGTLNCRIALKFDRHIGSTAAEVPVKFHSDRTGCILHFKCWCRRYTKSELDHQYSSRRNNAGPSAGTVLTTKLPMIVVQVFSLLMISKTFSMGGRHFGKSRSTRSDKQRFLTPGHQGWNDLHSLCRIGMEYYLLNNDDNNIIYWIIMIMMTMIIIMIIMMTMMIIGTATIMIMIIIITTTLTMTIMKMIMIKTAQTPCQSLYKDRRI